MEENKITQEDIDLAKEFQEHKKENAIVEKPIDNKEVVKDFIDVNDKLTDAKRYQSEFSKAMSQANEQVAKELTADKNGKVYKDMENALGGAITQTALNEKAKAEYDAKIIALQNKITENEHLIEELKQQKTGYEKKYAEREFVYKGVEPVLKMVGIDSPASKTLMIILTIFLTIPYVFWKLVRGIFVTPMTGMEKNDRANLVKGYLWTLLALVITAVILVTIFVPLSIYGII